MTGPSRGSPDLRHQSHIAHGLHRLSVSAEPTSNLRRPSLELQRSNVTEVRDAARLVEFSQLQRQLHFQNLVRRYMSQILHGCTSIFCTTPTCLSCNRRLVTRPLRAPTQLTARALAHFLASQDDPERGLCHNRLKTEPSTLEIEGAENLCISLDARGIESSLDGIPVTKSFVAVNSRSIQNRPALHTISSVTGEKEHVGDVDKVVSSFNERRQKKKDVKSLGQNLYDSVTVIYALSKCIPSSLSVFAALRTRYLPHETSPSEIYGQGPFICTEGTSPIDSSNANGHAIPPNVNADPMQTQNAQHNSQCSHGISRRSSTHIASEVLDNGERVHKVRHQVRLDRTSNRRSSFKAHGPVAFDGIAEPPAPQISNMKNRLPSPTAQLLAKVDPMDHSISTKEARCIGQDGEKACRILPVASRLDCDIMDQLKEEVRGHRHYFPSYLNFALEYDTRGKFERTGSFVTRSLFFTLSDTDALVQSFHDENQGYKNSPLPHLNSCRLTHSFRDWNKINGALVFDSLWIAAGALFRPPPALDMQKSPCLKASRRPSVDDATAHIPIPESSSATNGRYLSDEEAAHLVMICIHALTSLVPQGWPHTWTQLRKFRSWGILLPNAQLSDEFTDPWLSIVDGLEYEPALRLADRLLRGIGARRCFEHILETLGHSKSNAKHTNHVPVGYRMVDILARHLIEIERQALARKKLLRTSQNYDEDPGWTVTSTFIEWLRTLIIKKWDGKAGVNRWDSVGTAISLLDIFHTRSHPLNLRTHMFIMPYLHERLDTVSEPYEFLQREYHPNYFHILECPLLFPPHYLVAYFRTMNFTTMYKQFEKTERVTHLQRELDHFLQEPYWVQIRDMLKVTFSDYLVLDVTRENALKDTLDQLWGRERRLLLKPLKVKIGMQGEGEVGLDQGGVTSEFFRVVLHEAFNPDTGMFTLDEQTRMTWFKPASPEPSWKFEMLGILFSLAVYNGITLPVTFPLAFYYNLLAPIHPRISPTYPTYPSFIEDGWPGLAKSFNELLSWDQGDVADVFLRSYSFSFEAFGRNIDVDMQAFDTQNSVPEKAWPADFESKFGRANNETFGLSQPLSSPLPDPSSTAWMRPKAAAENSSEAAAIIELGDTSEETPLVTNANREKYVADYIYWLTYKSVAPQLLAFRKGFLACLQPRSLVLFDPLGLKALIEGTQDIDATALRAATRYEDGYSVSHPTIVDFWSIVEEYSMDDRRKLLEFVTASERVPITGFDSMNFVIVRSASDTEMLPTSSTCFGKLMLPQYTGKEKLKRKLGLAIQNAKGFGVV